MDTTPDLDTLFAAIDNGDTAAVQAALDAGLSPNAADAKGCTLLHRACSRGEAGYNIARLLLQAGADVNQRQQNGESALSYYIECSGYLDEDENGTDLCELLLAHGADVNVRNQAQHTPLHDAAHFGRTAVLELLIQAGADVNAVDNDGDTPLLLAAINAATPQKTELLLKAGADPNRRSRDEQQDTALDRAITDLCVYSRERGERTVYLLRRFGAREGVYMERLAKQPSEESPTKQMLRAVDNNDKHALLRQLAAGADINAYGDSRSGAFTALMKAARFGLPNIVRLLLEHGADATLRDADGLTALSHAVHGDNEESIRLLLNAGLNPHDEPRSLLHRAAREGYVRALAALLRHTDLDPRHIEDGTTPRTLAEQYFTEYSLECGYGDIIVLLQRAEKKH